MNVLFICTGNTCRSPMAEGLFKQLTKDKGIKFDIGSAGVSAYIGDLPAENAVIACKEYGADISKHTASHIRNVDTSSVDLFVAMTMEHAQTLMQKGVPQNKIYILNVPDPFGSDLITYKECCGFIYEQLQILLELIERNNLK